MVWKLFRSALLVYTYYKVLPVSKHSAQENEVVH